MAFHEMKSELTGIYARAAFLGSSLPTECDTEKGFFCGRVNLQLSRVLQNFFMIREDRKVPRDLNISFKERSDESGQGVEATIFVSVDDKRAAFFITSLRIDNNGTIDAVRELVLKRELGNGIVLSEFVKPRSLEFKAFNQIMDLAHTEKLPIERWSLCRTCPAQVNGLPGTEI